jgi:hypothetical protein
MIHPEHAIVGLVWELRWDRARGEQEGNWKGVEGEQSGTRWVSPSSRATLRLGNIYKAIKMLSVSLFI